MFCNFSVLFTIFQNVSQALLEWNRQKIAILRGLKYVILAEQLVQYLVLLFVVAVVSTCNHLLTVVVIHSFTYKIIVILSYYNDANENFKKNEENFFNT